MLTYKDTQSGISVFLDGKKIGRIENKGIEYRYVPNAGAKFAGRWTSDLNKLKKEMAGE